VEEKMKRSAAREDTFKLLYSLEVQKENNIEEQTDLYFENENIIDEDTKKFIKSIVLGIEKNLSSIENSIATNLKKDWKLDRISKVDLVLLKLAVYEILYTDVPYKVATNEAIELSKKYGDETSPYFINGILASIIKESGKAND
jgi:transcription antitermination protein NusB